MNLQGKWVWVLVSVEHKLENKIAVAQYTSANLINQSMMKGDGERASERAGRGLDVMDGQKYFMKKSCFIWDDALKGFQ